MTSSPTTEAGAARGTCPDCEGALTTIKLVDATERIWSEGSYRVDLTYAALDAQAPFGGFFGGIPPQGRVEGRMCVKCGRILLYGRPY